MPRETGFPDHPHRGLTTVTNILQGQWAHEDFLGNCGTLQPGEVQWMSSGRGIMHCEMPVHDGPDAVDPVALQLWVDTPADKKMDPPSYLGLKKEEWVDGRGGLTAGVPSRARTRASRLA
jgi:redox-sensitive bicupin YhaK (pirin superfamily)